MTEPVSVHSREAAYVDPSLTASLHKVPWGAIIAGVVLALAVQFLLNLLGVGIGATIIDPATYDSPAASTFSIAGGIWFVLAGILASFVGGYVASRLSGRPSHSTGGYQGVVTWAVTTLVILYLLTTYVGALIGGAFSGFSSIVGGVGQTAATAATTAAPDLATSGNPMTGIEQQIRNASGGNDPAALRDAAVSAVQAAVTGDDATAADARNRAADAVAKAQNILIEQARTQVQQYEKTYRDNIAAANQKALTAAQTATDAVSAAILGFFALLLGAVAAWFGGSYGTKRNLVLTDTTTRRTV